eukprot:641009-Amorphochlora_amoeboformis.AAC.1
MEQGSEIKPINQLPDPYHYYQKTKDGKPQPYEDETLGCLGRRLGSVLKVRSLQQELLRLIPRQKAEKLGGMQALSVLEHGLS